MDVWDLIRAIKEGNLDVLRRELAAGYDPNTACRYTGMTALLGASEADDLVAVEVLLAAGADPNLQHSDGYTTYDSTRSRAVKEALLRGGFRLVMDHPRGGRGLDERRMFAPTPVTEMRTQKLDGRTVTIELARATLPEPAGEVIVRVPGHPDLRPDPGDHITLPAMAGPIEVTTVFIEFVGELFVRLWDEETIATNQGSREFWLPAWNVM